MRGKHGLKFGMLKYPDQLQSWWDFGHGPLIPPFEDFDLVKLDRFEISLCIFLRTRGSTGMKLVMLMYPDYL